MWTGPVPDWIRGLGTSARWQNGVIISAADTVLLGPPGCTSVHAVAYCAADSLLVG